MILNEDGVSLTLEGQDVESSEGEFGVSSCRGIAMVEGGSPTRTAELAALAQISGYRPVAQSFGDPSNCLLIDLRSEMEAHPDSLSEIAQYLGTHRSVALVWTDMDGLEAAYAALPQGQCHFLVDADDVEAMPILIGALGRGTMDQLHDRNREVEFGSLHRISDELAEFARALSQIAESDRNSGVSDKPVSFRPAPVGGFQAFPTAATTPAIDAKTLRNVIKKRRQRERYFDSELFADPAWDILLDLKAAALEGQSVSVSSLCIAAAVPPTTALRWITAMTENGMLVRRQDPDDARRVFIDLSDESSAKLEDYFAAALDQPGPTIG